MVTTMMNRGQNEEETSQLQRRGGGQGPWELLAVSFTRAVVFSFFPTKSPTVLSRTCHCSLLSHRAKLGEKKNGD